VRFRQILLNIIGNAVKFTARGGVHVQARLDEHRLEVRIDDSGIGIASAQVERLFQPFVQVDDPLSRRFGGTGLGLALSKKLCGLLGGDLWIERSRPGHGSTFIFTVANQPSANTDARDLENESTSTAPVVLKGFSILAAEDSLDNRILLELYLRPTLAKVTFATNGVEAIKLAKTSRFDLILMDIQMPEMDGFEAVAQLRNDGWNGPIVALSAHAHQPERERALKGGFSAYLVKPITRDKLWQALQTYAPTGQNAIDSL
jgi:CheY-like chemotaxis protein/anti-sigma regulatory factor (Ser/Thr protein kinase)